MHSRCSESAVQVAVDVGGMTRVYTCRRDVDLARGAPSLRTVGGSRRHWPQLGFTCAVAAAPLLQRNPRVVNPIC